MTRFIIALATAGLTATSAAALTTEARTFMEDQSLLEQNRAFIGDPFYDSNGLLIGQVVDAEIVGQGTHRLSILFNEGFSADYTGMVFNLDDFFVSDGVLRSTDSSAEILSYLNLRAAQGDTVPASVLAN